MATILFLVNLHMLIEYNQVHAAYGSDNLNIWGYAYTPNGAKTFTSDATVKKVNLTSGNWATVNGVDLLSALK